MIRLTPELIKAIEEILNDKNTAEIAVRKDKIIVWSVKSKKKHEQPIA